MPLTSPPPPTTVNVSIRASSSEAPYSAASKDPGVTPRVVVLCLVLAALFGSFMPVIDYKFMNTFLGGSHLPPGAVGVLLILVLALNPAVGAVSKALRFTRNEALTVYITCLFSSLVPGHGGETFIIPNLLSSFYFANRQNKWLDQLAGHVPHWLTPALNADGTVNHAVLDGWYQGGPVPWGAWAVPLLFWGSLALCSYTMLACLALMLRAQWAQNEALAFPLLRLPLEMTQDLEATSGRERFFRNPLMWSGFGVAVFIELMRGLHVYFPLFPMIPMELNMGPYLGDPPWNQIGWVPVQIYPIAVGIAFLLTSEVSFSLWFFWWFMRFQVIVLYYLGYPSASLISADRAVPGPAFTGFQMVGCYLAWVGLILWNGRQHALHIVWRAFGQIPPRPEEAKEALSYPAAFWGFIGGLAGTVGLTMLAGADLDLALVLWGGYLIFAIGLTRVAAEGGMLFLLNDSAPLGIAGRLFGADPSRWLSYSSGVVPAAFVQGGFAVHMRGFSMPSYLHAFKLAHDRNIAAKPLLRLIAAVVVLSFTIAMTTCVRLGYDNEGLNLEHTWWARYGSQWPIGFIHTMFHADNNSPVLNWSSVAIGVVLTVGMMFARSRFAAFPFHPIGYVMAQTYPGNMFWFSIFLAWAAKSLVTRYGGIDSYRRLIPAFLGLALGDVTMILFWLAIDGWQGHVSHALMPQ